MKPDKYHEIDKSVGKHIRARMLADGVRNYPVTCNCCSGTGKHEADNNGSISDCPVCNGDGAYFVAV